MNRADFTNLGGFPLEQDTLKFLQESYTAALSGVAKLCGNKTILAGVEVTGGAVTDGWISYNGELIPFVGGSFGAEVVITESATAVTFEDNTEHDVYFKKTATCGVIGEFSFSELTPLSFLQNIWMPGDIKEKYCDGAYIAANFDVNGFGLGKEKGWRILSKAIPSTAGKVFVNIDFEDPDLDEGGKTGGSKTHTLTIAEMPAHSHDVDDYASLTGTYAKGKWFYADPGNGTFQGTAKVKDAGGGQPHNNMQPYFVILKLIKL